MSAPYLCRNAAFWGWQAEAMAMSSHTLSPKAELREARARRARAWAWPVRLALVVCIGVAIWKEPRLAPRLHALMQDAAAYAASFEITDRARAMLARTSGESSSGNGEGL